MVFTGSPIIDIFPTPTIIPLSDSALLIRFATVLTGAANRAAIALAAALEHASLEGVVEIVPSLVSVLLRYDPLATAWLGLTGQLRLRLYALDATMAAALNMTMIAFIAAHNTKELRVLANGFAPGFVYSAYIRKRWCCPAAPKSGSWCWQTQYCLPRAKPQSRQPNCRLAGTLSVAPILPISTQTPSHSSNCRQVIISTSQSHYERSHCHHPRRTADHGSGCRTVQSFAPLY